MLKRTLFFSNPCRLSIKDAQMVIQYRDEEKITTVPIEDTGFIVLENMQITVTLPLLEALVANNVAVVFCNERHYPQSLLLNLDGHNTQSEIFRNQIYASEPLKKNLWKQTVEEKILNQARLLEILDKEHLDIRLLARDVKSGDADNKEAAAARLYWSRLFGKEFQRERFGDYPNSLLNYGYIVLRAATARALTGSGLLPTLGIHHQNKYNAYCLADDIMEPYRPFVDRRVYQIFKDNPVIEELTKTHKTELLMLLTDDVFIDNKRSPLMLALSRTTAALARCYAGESRILKYPELK